MQTRVMPAVTLGWGVCKPPALHAGLFSPCSVALLPILAPVCVRTHASPYPGSSSTYNFSWLCQHTCPRLSSSLVPALLLVEYSLTPSSEASGRGACQELWRDGLVN